jgi:hypothetical protein
MADQIIIDAASSVVASAPELVSVTSNPIFQQALAYAPQGVIFLAGALIIWRAHVNAGSKFNVFDYFSDESSGKASITRTLQMLAGLTATWIVVKLAVAGTLSTEMFGVYLAALGVSAGWSKYISAKFGTKNDVPATPVVEEQK